MRSAAPRPPPAPPAARRPPPAAHHHHLTSSPPRTSTRSESFTLRDLVDCDIYLLDHASEVEAAGLRGCRVFLGPVDGPAIFDNCSNCTVAVASQQFQARGCRGCAFGLYCATGPALAGCADVALSCWAGAYPGLAAHFAAASLDPLDNQWARVYDADAGGGAEEGGAPARASYSLAEGPEAPWVVTAAEVPGLEGAPENPVPQPAAAAALEDAALPLENGRAPAAEAEAAPGRAGGGGGGGGAPAEPVAAAAAREGLAARLAAQACAEAETRAATAAAAAAYLERFHAARAAAREERARAAAAAPAAAVAGPKGEGRWERTASMVELTAGARAAGAELTRFREVLAACKAREAAKRAARA